MSATIRAAFWIGADAGGCAIVVGSLTGRLSAGADVELIRQTFGQCDPAAPRRGTDRHDAGLAHLADLELALGPEPHRSQSLALVARQGRRIETPRLPP